MSSAVYPGPGAYENTKTAIQTGPNVGVSMKHKEKAKRYMGFGADQEWKGQESPGPGMVRRGHIQLLLHLRFRLALQRVNACIRKACRLHRLLAFTAISIVADNMSFFMLEQYCMPCHQISC